MSVHSTLVSHLSRKESKRSCSRQMCLNDPRTQYEGLFAIFSSCPLIAIEMTMPSLAGVVEKRAFVAGASAWSRSRGMHDTSSDEKERLFYVKYELLQMF